jgi:2-aminoethylphosphonate dioxygenase
MEQSSYGLSAEQLSQYDAEGFLALPRYLDLPTVEALREAADELVERVGPVVRGNPRIQVDLIGGAPRIRQVWPIVDLHEAFAQLAQDPRIVAPMVSLFDDTPVLFEDKLNYKYGGGGTAFPMHQDYSYWQPYSPRLTSVLIYLDEATLENGCLEVAPGWHKRGLLPIEKVRVGLSTDHTVPAEVLAPSLAVPLPGPAGTMVIFGCTTPHSSRPNLSRRSRRAVILTYNPAADGSFYEETSGANREKSLAWRL